MEYTAQELYKILNDSDECYFIEAKGGSESSHSVMESVCSFSNEPGLGGGYILMGIAEDKDSLVPQYKVLGVSDTDKFQKDIATQCKQMFNIPVYPQISVENINGKNVVVVHIKELSDRQKPLYFKSDGIPHGIMRRIGSSDLHCTEDDLQVFYRDNIQSYDQTTITGTDISQIDEAAIKRYRTLRSEVNPAAEELTYDDAELLEALGCLSDNKKELNLAGVLLFGNSKVLRSKLPMMRVDYIRVPGNQWVENPDDRFITTDMRGPLILLVYRLINAINDDLPKGFLLPDNSLQAKSVGLPIKALREAIVNALIHRSYRVHRPTQVIRYDNRIEIINPGYSLKAEDQLGKPGSETRNPFIASVFHETNLAETKGTGIRAMRKLMIDAHLAPPTYESSYENNQFTMRLLLHHFLDEKDIQWLGKFTYISLNDVQKQTLIFVREIGAIDNRTYRQMADSDISKASSELRYLRNQNLLSSKGKGKSTYYVAGSLLIEAISEIGSISDGGGSINYEGSSISNEGGSINYEGGSISDGGGSINYEGGSISNGGGSISDGGGSISKEELLKELPNEIIELIISIKGKERNAKKIKEVILLICTLRAYKLSEIALIIQRGEKYISNKFIKPMLDSGELNFSIPEMRNHPDQGYITQLIKK
nr:ATP-binding protein [uncultured Bacteroides sp.]